MEIHHSKHHQTYITNANGVLENNPDLASKSVEALISDLDSIPESARTPLRNNAGGHSNHSFFWKIIAPAGSDSPIGALASAIDSELGGIDSLKEAFAKAGATRFGSGWAWLSVKDGKLAVHSTANQDSPLMEGGAPIIGLDVWEHAYYLNYQNRRPDYIGAFWNVVNWSQAEENYAAATA
jgi:Fe-Mn family superoxide dismutase